MSPERAFSGTDFKVYSNAALPQPRGAEGARLSVLAAPGTLRARQRVLLSLRGSSECVQKAGIARAAGLMAGLGHV